jgi:UDP-3-O-[3-hydroxymyristoyl] glucosamine N-acyltransferase
MVIIESVFAESATMGLRPVKAVTAKVIARNMTIEEKDVIGVEVTITRGATAFHNGIISPGNRIYAPK